MYVDNAFSNHLEEMFKVIWYIVHYVNNDNIYCINGLNIITGKKKTLTVRAKNKPLNNPGL